MRKAQMNAAVLIAIVSALIIIYILFLPSEERLDLIGENETVREDRETEGDDLLFEETSIIMDVIGSDEVERNLPSVNLFTRTSADVLRDVSSIYVKNGLFDKQDHEIDFRLDDPDNTDNILISFFAKTAKGRLMISLNGHKIYDNEVDKVNVDPIPVPEDLLAATNNLYFEVSGVGAKFWGTNEYLLENFKVTADVTDISTRESVISFVVPREEAKNVEEAHLRFVPECKQGEVGILDISINEKIVYSSVPDCGTVHPIEFAPNLLIRGDNTLEFGSDRGRYLIDQIEIVTDLIEQPSYTYFFEIDDDEWEEFRDGDKNINLTFFFVDDEEEKEAEILINERKTFMTRHYDFEWSTLIDNFVERGDNSLKIIPEERLEIRKITVTLEDED
ncbi:hypothetical protein GOV09_06190 [Candidatus Woesearchaeota archaeon]|nr:hypothetical protein [Candidatus Woesearchaeota archaeon]